MNLWPFKKIRSPISLNTDIDINDPIVPSFIRSIAAAGIGSNVPALGTKVNFIKVDFGCWKFNSYSYFDIRRLKQRANSNVKELLMMCTYICFSVNDNKYCYNAVTDLFENYANNNVKQDIMFNHFFLNKDSSKLNQINELSSFLIQKEKSTDKQQLLIHKERLITLLSYDYNWLCAEHENIGILIEENNKAIAADPEHENDDLYSKSYDLYHFNKYYILAPFSLLKLASSYQFIFSEDFSNCIDKYKSKNKEILRLTEPKFHEVV